MRVCVTEKWEGEHVGERQQQPTIYPPRAATQHTQSVACMAVETEPVAKFVFRVWPEHDYGFLVIWFVPFSGSSMPWDMDALGSLFLWRETTLVPERE